MSIRSLTTNILGGLAIVGLATGLSFAALAKPSLGWKSPVVEQVVTPVPAPVETPAPVVTPEPAPAPVAPAELTATTKSFVRLREGPSTSTDILAELQGGTTVTLLEVENSLWQQVRYGNLIGYIYKSYLQY